MPDLAGVAATLRAYVEGSGALAATLAFEETVMRCDAGGEIEVAHGEEGEPQGLGVPPGAAALDLGLEVRRLPAFDADEVSGEVTGVIGGLEHVAECARALAAVPAPDGVALVELPTSDGTPLALSARAGEGIVVVIGDEQFEMDPAWPPPR